MLIENLMGAPLGIILLASFAQYVFGVLMTLTAIFLILLVLVQRGRGGGLAGAFGGMGGQSAFGTKAGDTFTKVTIGVSIFWIILCIASVKILGTSGGSFGQATAPDQPQFVPGMDSSGEPILPATPGALEGDGGLTPGLGTGTEAEITPETSTEATDTSAESSENN